MPEEYILKVTDVSKSFAGVKALNKVHLEIKPGEIHCLAGENGCGKSTIIKVISGVYTMDEGVVEFSGKQYTEITPREAIMNGIQVIYQDFSIFPNLTVMENLAYNTELAEKKKFVNWKRMREIAQKAAGNIDFKVDLNTLVGDLSVADKQLVAISRALMHGAKLIIMDEPTTALTKKEVTALFKIILDLQKQGIAVLFVSHKLDEVFEISERFTIMRNGENVITCNADELDDKKFSYYMTGREFESKFFEPANVSAEPVLEVRDLSMENGFYNVDFDLRKGEILGITGLLGSGRTELALALFGLHKTDSGTIMVHGKPAEFTSVQKAMKENIGYLPEDRLTEGLFLSRSIADNITVSEVDNLTRGAGFWDDAKRQSEVDKWVADLKIATKNPENAANTLSGGNQQRIVLARWLATHPDILIMNGPTVGVDIGSKHDIHETLHNLANNGMAIIIISDDIPEVIRNCSRVLLMKAGKITGEVNPREISENQLAEMMTSSDAS
ncbi:MAG TPA: lipase [Clostridiales bacterium]|nr:lipase [Clostridiales bacterium]